MVFLYYWKGKNLTVAPQYFDGINYNNYTSNNIRFDSKYGKCAYVNGFRLTIIDSNGNTNKMFYHGDSFQLYKDGIIYLEENKLKLLETKKKETIISSNVHCFVVKNDSVLYCSDSTLYNYDITKKISTIIAEDIITFRINDDSLIVLSRTPNQGQFDSTINVYNNEYVVVKSLKFILPYAPFDFMITNDNIVYEDNNSIFFLNLNTGKIKNVSLSERTMQDTLPTMM